MAIDRDEVEKMHNARLSQQRWFDDQHTPPPTILLRMSSGCLNESCLQNSTVNIFCVSASQNGHCVYKVTRPMDCSPKTRNAWWSWYIITIKPARSTWVLKTQQLVPAALTSQSTGKVAAGIHFAFVFWDVLLWNSEHVFWLNIHYTRPKTLPNLAEWRVKERRKNIVTEIKICYKVILLVYFFLL